MSLRILVVEDYEPCLHSICSTLERRPDFCVVGKAVDGLQAVESAQLGQPDLILLDIGLPKLNGLQAAKRIRKLVPNAKILFLSAECSEDVVRACLDLGALGYIHKPEFHNELLPAIDAICEGKRFVSNNWGGGSLLVKRDPLQAGMIELARAGVRREFSP